MPNTYITFPSRGRGWPSLLGVFVAACLDTSRIELLQDANVIEGGAEMGSAGMDGAMGGADGPDGADSPTAGMGGAGDADGAITSGCAVEIAMGGAHSCARRSDNTLWCWGENNESQLGDGTLTNRPVPVQILALGANVIGVAAGSHHTCARRSDNTLWCWGENSDGQLGDGTTTRRPLPVPVAASLGSVSAVAMGRFHTCARKTDGTLWCWGNNFVGQLGIGGTMKQLAPVQVSALGTNVAEVAAGANFTCARRDNGTLWCWGNNAEGQLGTGTAGGGSQTPVQVPSLGTAVTAVAVGYYHACARLMDNSLRCWGANDFGQTSMPIGGNQPTPTAVAPLGLSVVQVTAGVAHICALRSDRSVWCWGWNEGAQLGDGMMVTRHEPRVVAAVGTNTDMVAAGSHFTCRLRNDRTIWCWGLNRSGALGNGPTGVIRPLPVMAALPCP